MITAPDVFAVSDGTYTPDVAIDWVAQHGEATVLHLGRTLRYSTADGWEFGPQGAAAKPVWKSIDKAPKTLKRAFDTAVGTDGGPEIDDRAEGYYELIGPGLAGNPHGKADGEFALVRHGVTFFDEQPPRTSLYALAKWIAKYEVPGILWRWDTPGGDTQFAAVRVSLLP
jgi:hypothetical protein